MTNDLKKNIRQDKAFIEEKDRLTKLFKDIPTDKKTVVAGLLDSAAFMRVILDRCQADIEENGYVEEYQNGANQFGKKRSISADVYATYNKLYQTVVKQLLLLLPEKTITKDELSEFLDE